MDGEEDQRDQHEERLREVFENFDGSGAGSLSPEELTELCHALQLADQAIHTLLQTLFDTQDKINTRVEFEQFKDALILVLSSPQESQAEENDPRPVSPEVQPRFVKGTKRYGRRSTPEFTNSISDLAHAQAVEGEEEDASRTNDGTLPVKRERWNADVRSTEEYEAEGQLHLWNPDELGTPRGSIAPFSDLEERLYSVCQQLSVPLHGTATIQQLNTLCQHLGLEVGEEVFQSAHERNMSVLQFVSCIQSKSKPPTPSASTPYRQLKRHHSTQPFDEMGRRITSVMCSTIGLQLFSVLDDGTGHTAVDLLLDAWQEDGVENSTEILQALDFNLEGKVNLSELTAALENELMVTRNSIHQAALASFRAEIRYLLERVDLEIREKEKLYSDLEKAEKLKSQLASEVDEHHTTIERINNLNLRKLEQEHKDRVVALKAEFSKEMELEQQQANRQREELELEISKIRQDETSLREHLTLTLKENARLETELVDSTERLMEVEALLTKLQKNLDNVLKEKFGDLDLSNPEFYKHEERFRQMRNSYEEQCRELQDRIDELQCQLKEFHALGHAPQTSHVPSLSEELDTMSPGTESDQGLGSEEGQPFNMSLEAEMMLEQLKEQHIRELEDIRAQLESTANKCEERLKEQKATFEEVKSLLSLQHQQEMQAMREELNEALKQVQDSKEQIKQERCSMETRQSAERAEIHAVYQQQVGSLSQEVQDARIQALKLEEQLRLLEEQEESKASDKEELSKVHEKELSQMKVHYTEILKTSLIKQEEEAKETLFNELEKERQCLEEVHKEVLRVQLEEVQQRAEQERVKAVKSIREEWEWDKQQLEKSSRKTLQDELEHLQRKQEEGIKRLREQFEKEHGLLKEQHQTELQKCLQQEKERLQVQQEEKERRMIEEWARERVQLHEQQEEVLQSRLEKQRAEFQTQGEKQERSWQKMLEEKLVQMEKQHWGVVQDLNDKHKENQEMQNCMLEKLHADINKERNEARHLAEENILLRQSISGLREEDLNAKQQELLLKLEHFRQERNTAQKMADGLKRQISELRRHGKLLEKENNSLSQQNAKQALSVDTLQHTLEEVILHHGNGSSSERNEIIQMEGDFAASLNRTEKLEEEKKLLRAELNRCVEKMAQLRSAETQLAHVLQERQLSDKHNQALHAQMLKAQERVQTLDCTLQGLTQQNTRLKSDLRITQKERDTLKQEVISLHKRLQNANEKCHLAEMSASGVPGSSHQGKRVWPELSLLVESERTLLREENQRLQREISDSRLELNSAREKARQLEALVLSVKQQKLQNQASLTKTAEQERSAFRREIEALQIQLHNKLCDSSEEQKEIENLQEENESLRNKQTVLEAQLMEAQCIAMLPPSPLRLAAEKRGPCHDEMKPDINTEHEVALLKMEARMKEVELTLRNVKLLLQEKVSQLKEQLNKNSKADVLIKDLYVENSHLLKALEVSEQRQKMTEKKNYLLEEKISSLNKIVRELSPSTLMPVPYHVTHS